MPGPYDGALVLVYVNMSEPGYAALTVGTANAAYTVTANDGGTGGNSITYAATAAGTTPLVVSVTGTAITVQLAATAGTATSTAVQVRDAINTHIVAKQLVTASLPLTSTGASVSVAIALTSLTGGAAAAAASYQPVARQQGIDLEDTMDTIDATSKGDRFAIQLAGRQSGSFELSGLQTAEDTTQARLKRAYQKREDILVRIITPASVTGSVLATEEATCQLTGFSRSYPDSDVATFSAPVVLKENWRSV